MGRARPNDEMKFTDLFIKRPVLAMVVSFVILIAGLQAMKTLNVRQYPRSDVAAITVTTVYVGADAELIGQALFSCQAVDRRGCRVNDGQGRRNRRELPCA